MTREEYDQLDSNGKEKCPDCGLSITRPYGGCGCPDAWANDTISYTRHINKWHHDCEDAKSRLKAVNDEIRKTATK